MSEKESKSNNDINNSHFEFEQNSKFEEWTENRQCQLIEEIYPASQNEDISKKNTDEDNKNEVEDRKSTSLDSEVSEEKNPKPIEINIKNKDTVENNKDNIKIPVKTNIIFSENDENSLINCLDQFDESNLESLNQSENSNNEESIKINLMNETNSSPKPKLIGKKAKRKWKFKSIRKASKKNKINGFLDAFLDSDLASLFNKKSNNIIEPENGDRLDTQKINYSDVCCNRKYYCSGYSPHIIEISESITRNHISFGNFWQTMSTNCNSSEASGFNFVDN